MKRVIPSVVRQWLTPRSLRYQLLARSLFIITGLLVVIGMLQYIFMSHFLYESTAQNLVNQIRSVPQQVWMNQSSSKNRGEPPLVPIFTVGGATVSFINPNGNFNVLFTAPDANPAPHLDTSVYLSALTNRENLENYQIVRTTNGRKNLVVIVPVGPVGLPVGVVQVSTDIRSLQQVLMQQLLVYICLGAASLLLALLALIATLKRTLIPLSQMSATMKQIDAGNMDQRIELHNPQTEIKALADSFNSMLGSLSSSFDAERRSKEKMRQFVADASHELRTPLTSLQGFIDVLQRGAMNHRDQLVEALSSMDRETKRLSKLVQNLLTLARFDENRALEMKQDDLTTVLKEMEPQLAVLAGDRRLRLKLEDSICLLFDRDKIKQVVLNLFQNSVAHTDPTCGEIEVSLVKNDQLGQQGISLTVRDNGVGIPAEEIDLVFERFYRIDTARSRRQGGAGLGLSITQSIVLLHEGTIRCESELGKGTAFIVWLPMK